MENNKKSLDELMFYTDMMVQRARGGRNLRFGYKGGQMEQVLIALQTNNSTTSKELSETLGMSFKSLNRLLDRMEEAELITLKTVEEDKTLLSAELTETGKKAARKAEQRRAEMDKLFECLTEEEKNNLQSILLHLAENLEKELKEDDDSDKFWGREELFGGFWHGEENPRGYHGREGFHGREGLLRAEMFCNRGGYMNRGGFQPESGYFQFPKRHHNSKD